MQKTYASFYVPEEEPAGTPNTSAQSKTPEDGEGATRMEDGDASADTPVENAETAPQLPRLSPEDLEEVNLVRGAAAAPAPMDADHMGVFVRLLSSGTSRCWRLSATN